MFTKMKKARRGAVERCGRFMSQSARPSICPLETGLFEVGPGAAEIPNWDCWHQMAESALFGFLLAFRTKVAESHKKDAPFR